MPYNYLTPDAVDAILTLLLQISTTLIMSEQAATQAAPLLYTGYPPNRAAYTGPGYQQYSRGKSRIKYDRVQHLTM
jgi:hypothetical protein